MSNNTAGKRSQDFDEMGRGFARKLGQRLPEGNPKTQQGYMGNESGVVDVPDRTGFVYVTLQSNSLDPSTYQPVGGSVVEAWNPKRFKAPAGVEVRLGYDQANPKLLAVLGVAYDQRGTPDNWRDPDYPERGLQDYTDRDIDKANIRQLHLHPAPDEGAFVVEVYDELLYDATDQLVNYEATTIDLAEYMPASGMEVLAHVYLDPATKELGVVVGESYDQYGPGGVPVDPPDLAERIPAVPLGMYELAAVRLYGGQTEIDPDLDIADTRRLFTPAGGGGGLWAARTHVTNQYGTLVTCDGYLVWSDEEP